MSQQPSSPFGTLQDQRKGKVLAFLRSEIWSTKDVLGDVIGVPHRKSQWRVLKAMESDGTLISEDIVVFNKKVETVWGITSHGQTMAVDLEDPDDVASAQYFEPGRFSPMTAQHHLDIQMMRLRAEKTGWSEWLPGTAMGPSTASMKRPDAVAVAPCGERVALEIERTAKTRKRYVEIMSAALQAIKRGEYSSVHYVCPTPGLAARLERTFRGIKQVRVKGQPVQLQDQHYKRFRFFEYGEWPSHG